MTALAKDRNTIAKSEGRSTKYKVVASDVIYKGALVAMNTAGYLVPAAKTDGLRVVGVAEERADNASGAAGDISCRVRRGVFNFVNDGNALTQADIGRYAYVVDDQTVADETEDSTVVAGIVEAIDADGTVYVSVGEGETNVQPVGEETVTTGALSLYTKVSLLSTTGTIAYTLADGLFIGQEKFLIEITAASTPAGTLTPTTFADGTTVLFNADEESIHLIWGASGWRQVNVNGATVS